MRKNGNSRYPYHLARLVAARLTERSLSPPSQPVMLRLLETMYFASLKTDESRPCRCTINYVDPQDHANQSAREDQANRWSVIPLQQRVPLDVKTLTKIAEATDPNVSSLAVFSDSDDGLFIWGLVDQELRYGHHVSLESAGPPRRPGLFQATITGLGNITAYKDFELLGNLEQNSLIEEYHDVLWSGPVHRLLKKNLQATLHEHGAGAVGSMTQAGVQQLESELLIRWQNAVCRLLLGVKQIGHGGGLLIVPRWPAGGVNVKYPLSYNRLPRALLGLARHQLLKRQTTDAIAQFCTNHPRETLSCDLHYSALDYQDKLEAHKYEALGCVRFIASLSKVDGFVLLDRSLTVHGFGVESRSVSELSDIYIAGNPQATPRLQQLGSLSQFGTRHRAHDALLL